MYPNFYQSFLPREVLNEKFLKIGFSESGEDDFIRFFFKEEIFGRKPGTYLDIGCYHETAFSNTKLLNLLGWYGVAVDANPELKSPWLKARPDDKFLNYAIGQNSKQKNDIDFYRFSIKSSSTTNKVRAKEMIHAGVPLRDKVRVPCIGLGELSAQCLKLGFNKFDFINIDIECTNYLSELPLLLSLLKPRLLCIEALSFGLSIENFVDLAEVRCLNSSGYKPVAIIRENILAMPM